MQLLYCTAVFMNYMAAVKFSIGIPFRLNIFVKVAQEISTKSSSLIFIKMTTF